MHFVSQHEAWNFCLWAGSELLIKSPKNSFRFQKLSFQLAFRTVANRYKTATLKLQQQFNVLLPIALSFNNTMENW